MKFNPPARPVVETIRRFFAHPVKTGMSGQQYLLSATSVGESEAIVLAQLAEQFGRTHSLEIGLALGGSALAIAAARQHAGYAKPHVVLDPFQLDFDNVGLREIEKAGLSKSIEFREELSEEFLHNSVRQKETFDFVFSDSGKGIGQALTDAFFINRLLIPGGIVAFHDGLLYAHSVVWRFFAEELGYTTLALPSDGKVKVLGRIVRHSRRIGFVHSLKAVPKMHRSLFALQKPR